MDDFNPDAAAANRMRIAQAKPKSKYIHVSNPKYRRKPKDKSFTKQVFSKDNF